MAEALYYAKGPEVWKSPVRTKIEGGQSVSIGFHVCTASEVVGEDGAAAIAGLLCLGEQAQNPTPDDPRRPQNLDPRWMSISQINGAITALEQELRSRSAATPSPQSRARGDG
jgi:hypothetical protein